MTEQEYLSNVRSKLCEADPSLQDGFTDELDSLILKVRESAYTRTMLFLKNLTGIPVTTQKAVNLEVLGADIYKAELPENFLKLCMISAIGWEKPVLYLHAESFLPVQMDKYSRATNKDPIAVKVGNYLYLFGEITNDVQEDIVYNRTAQIEYIKTFRNELDNGDDGVESPRICDSICYYAASLVKTMQGDDGSFLLSKSEELL